MSQRSRFFDSAGAPITLATSAAADDIIDTATPHGFVAGQMVHFTALTGGSGLSTGVIYWVVSTSLGSTTFRVSATQGGTPINFTTDITAGTVVGGDRVYDSAAMAQVFQGLIGDGVVSGAGSELAVIEASPTSMNVRVQLGKMWVQGYFFEVFSANEVVAISAAHASLPRIDRIVVRRDLTGRQAILAVLTGTPNASPTAPALTQNASGNWEISLAQVAVGAAVTQILNANITSERTFALDPAATWNNLTGKPTVFAPTTHDHSSAGAGVGGNVPWTSVSGKPSTFAPSAHASSHLPGAGDALTTVAPAFGLGTAAAVGSAASFVRSDATIALFDATAPVAVTGNSTNDPGVAGKAARRDHAHDLNTAAPNLVFSTSNAEGASASVMRADATIALFDATNPSSQVVGDVADVGVAGRAARRDHKHAISNIVAVSVFSTIGVISPTISANTDNWAPSGFSTATIIRANVTGSFNLTGIAGGTDGRRITLVNVGGGTLTLKHQTTSAAANQLVNESGLDYNVGPNTIVELFYDQTSSRWRVNI